MAAAQRIILGIDPGTNILGYGVILVDKKSVHYVDMGVIDLRKEKDHFLKLSRIFEGVGALMDRYAPDDLAIEAPFFGKNVQSMLKLGRAQGAAIAAGLHRQIPVFEYAPRKVKMAIVDWRCTPSVAIDDPDLMMGMPPALTAATGMDALTHAVEAYVSTAATPMTDACAEKAMEYINRYLRRAVANGQDKEAREGMCYAEYLAGMAFNNASLGHVHAMAHQLGGFYNLPHGECNAILLPFVEEYNRISNRRRFGKIAQLLGEVTQGKTSDEASKLAIKAIRILSQDVGIPAGLIELGKRYGVEVKAEDIPTMTANAQKDACGLTNPRRMTDKAVADIYTAAL